MPFSSRFLLLLLIFSACTSQQKTVKTDTLLLDNLRAHVQYLADDKLEGRRTGTEGETLAMKYIESEFKKIGLVPKGTEDYSQSFEVNDGKKIDDVTELFINGNKLITGKEFFPFPFSQDTSLEAMPVIAVQEADVPWFFDLKETLEENKANPHFDLQDYIRINSKKAKERGASAIVLYNSSTIDDKLVFESKDRSEELTIPVLYIQKEAAQKYFSDKAATMNIKMRISISTTTRIGHNVIGFIDNGAATTVVLGAHYDHLGYGEDGNSRNTTTERLIHNGADDNASGTAALIELARLLKSSPAKNNNYLFIAFSGEELGLFGSKYFVEHPSVDLKNVSYMINMDMIGRLSDSTKVLTIGGIGTSPAWGDVYKPASFYKQTMVFKYDSSGTGPSDHTSFYRKDIPVLFYFTGLHTDYHKPSDDADKINYTGEQMIIRHIYSVIEAMNSKGKIAFTKTKETQTTTNASFKVTLGIMPDYTYAGTGVRADGVTEGRPAAKAGLKTGDIIIQLGDNTITSLESYMQALGKFKKGDKTKVKYKRGNETGEGMVEF
ncbi:MAG TPA: M20/M25/M40 family metallo-hydrolase [Chitinophagaceae bacterium]